MIPNNNPTKGASMNMDKQTQATSNDMGTLAEDARALMSATADVDRKSVV